MTILGMGNEDNKGVIRSRKSKDRQDNTITNHCCKQAEYNEKNVDYRPLRHLKKHNVR
jgi:hypothetical protein